MRYRSAALGLVLLATLVAGCSSTPPAASSNSPGASSEASAPVSTPATALAGSDAMALPTVDGSAYPAPARARSLRDLEVPRRGVLLNREALVLIGHAVEGTMTARVTEMRKPFFIVVRVERFEVRRPGAPPESTPLYFLPAGTLVRVLLPDTGKGEKPVALAGIGIGVSTEISVSFSSRNGGAARLLAVR